MRCWLNGRIMDAEQAAISPFDRGFLFGDGVYEAVLCFNRTGVGMDLHAARLARSLREASIAGFDARTLPAICEALLRDAGLDDGMVYLQVTRGVQMPRRHLPRPELVPTVFSYASPAPRLEEMHAPHALRCVTRPDQRWERCDIKTTALIANVIASMSGHAQQADEVILHRDGVVTEATMSNVFIVRKGVIVTPPDDASPAILSGVMRRLLLDAASADGRAVEVRPLPVGELHDADEALITSSRRLLDGVVAIDDRPVGDGAVGPVTAELFELLRRRVAEECGVHLHSRR